MTGDKPIWLQMPILKPNENGIEELVEISQDKILFYELDTKNKVKKLIKSEDLKFYNKDDIRCFIFCDYFSDGKIWSCLLNNDANILHVINIGKKTENGTEKITNDNLEEDYYS